MSVKCRKLPSEGHPTNDRFSLNRSDRVVASDASLPTGDFDVSFTAATVDGAHQTLRSQRKKPTQPSHPTNRRGAILRLAFRSADCRAERRIPGRRFLGATLGRCTPPDPAANSHRSPPGRPPPEQFRGRDGYPHGGANGATPGHSRARLPGGPIPVKLVRQE